MPFVPGQSGNPKGRPKEKPIKDMLRLVLKDAEETGSGRRLRNMIEKVCEKAAAGDLEALKFIAERYEGKVPTVVVGDDEHDAVTVRTIVTGVPRAGDK